MAKSKYRGYRDIEIFSVISYRTEDDFYFSISRRLTVKTADTTSLSLFYLNLKY